MHAWDCHFACMLLYCALLACSWLRTMAEYTITSLLRSDGSVQTTSRVTLEHLPNFINGNEIQMFIRTHGIAHQQSVQSHGSSRDVPALTGQPRSRSARSRISRIQLTPGPQGHSDEEEDWGEWRSDGRRARSDHRRPRSPPGPPARGSPPENHIALVPLSVRRQVPDLGIHRFKLRTRCRIEEIAIELNDVLYYTLPSIAALVFPDPELLKKSWESVYRSLMQHRRSIIEDEQRIKSISEFPLAQPPHGVPGRWTEQVLRDISDYFQISRRSLPQQLIVQLGICEEKWPYISRTKRTLHHFSADKKNSQKNLFGIIFSFEPRRLLPDKQLTQSQSTFFWSHNTNIQAALQILRDDELIRPSKWQEHPSPNRECSNWNEVWLPPMGFYCRGSLHSQEAAIQAASQFGGIRTERPVCIGGSARLRQQHCTIPRGGVYADIAASHYYDCIHAKDGRWKLRSSIALPSYMGIFW